MKIKYLLTVVAIVAITSSSFAQFSQDVIRYSTSEPGSTARIKAIGNATTAIGGDLSSVSGNPAGIGFFTRSEASFTPEFNSTSVNGSYLGTSNSASSSTLNFNNASVVFYNKLNTPAGSDKGKGWLSLNFGASFNRSADYYETISLKGTNASNSISSYFADLANTQGVDPNGNGSSLQDIAYNNEMIDQYTGGIYKSNVFNSNGAPNKPVNQTDFLTREGGQTEFSFSVGGNYSNELYLGAGLGVSSIRYTLSRTFDEIGSASILDNNNNPVTANFNSAYTQAEETSGTGFNLRAGFIYKPIDEIRIGGSFTSPTWYTMQDDYAEGLSTAYTGNAVGTLNGGGPQDYQTTYSFHTPLKVSGGIAVFLGHSGFITGDVEYVDYSSIRLSSGDGYPSSNANSDNQDIKTFYKSTFNAHVGGELKLDQLYLRAGYGMQGDPVKNAGTNINTISGGLGYRFLVYYVDFTYTNVNGTQLVAPYTVNAGGGPVESLNKTSNNAFVTFGMRF